MTSVADMTDSQLILAIRMTESTPTGHQSFAIKQEIREYIAELRTEAARRGLMV